MGSRVSIQLDALLFNPGVVVRLSNEPLMSHLPYHSSDNPMHNYANVDFYRVDSEMNKVHLHHHVFDFSLDEDGNISLEADFNVFRINQYVTELQRALFECSVPHYVIPG